MKSNTICQVILAGSIILASCQSNNSAKPVSYTHLLLCCKLGKFIKKTNIQDVILEK